MNLSPYAANAILNGVAMPATLHCQLHLGNPGALGNSNLATDSTRKSFTRTTATLYVATNVLLIEWLFYPVVESISHLSIHDSGTPGGGNCWWIGEIEDGPVATVIDQAVEIAAGFLQLSLVEWT